MGAASGRIDHDRCRFGLRRAGPRRKRVGSCSRKAATSWRALSNACLGSRVDGQTGMAGMTTDEELIFRVPTEGAVEPLKVVGLAEIGYKEREHLQNWVEENPEIVGRGLLLVTAELDQWRFGDARVADRLDLLFLTSDGAPLVAELKRGEAPDTVDLQALKYAAYCSQLTVEDLVEAYGSYRKIGAEQARADVFEHASSLEEDGLGPVRVRLLAEGFRPSVTTTVMWMHQELGLDIGCVRVTARRLPDGSAVVSSRLILPPPAAEDYLVGVRRREGEQEERLRRERPVRRPNAVPRLLAAGVPQPGAKLVLRLDTFTQKEQDLVGALLESDSSAGEAEWTGVPRIRFSIGARTASRTPPPRRSSRCCSSPGPDQRAWAEAPMGRATGRWWATGAPSGSWRSHCLTRRPDRTEEPVKCRRTRGDGGRRCGLREQGSQWTIPAPRMPPERYHVRR